MSEFDPKEKGDDKEATVKQFGNSENDEPKIGDKKVEEKDLWDDEWYPDF